MRGHPLIPPTGHSGVTLADGPAGLRPCRTAAPRPAPQAPPVANTDGDDDDDGSSGDDGDDDDD